MQLSSETSGTPSATPSLANQYVTFRVGKLFFGVGVAEVQEIIRHQPLTPVPLAPVTVRGLANLRGQIIAAIDMRALLDLERFSEESTPMNVVICAGGEVVSLLVDGIGDVIDVEHSTFEPTPETIASRVSQIIGGVFKLERELMLILNTSVFLSASDI